MKLKLITLTILILLSGCAAEMVAYHPPSIMNAKDASATLVELSKKTDSTLEINEEYISFGKHNRVYYKSINKVAIYKHQLGEIQAYRVYIDSSDAGKYAYTTTILKDAEQYIDSLESLIYAYKTKHKEQNQTTLKPAISNREKLEELQSLRNKELISEDEFQKKRKQIIEQI